MEEVGTAACKKYIWEPVPQTSGTRYKRQDISEEWLKYIKLLKCDTENATESIL